MLQLSWWIKLYKCNCARWTVYFLPHCGLNGSDCMGARRTQPHCNNRFYALALSQNDLGRQKRFVLQSRLTSAPGCSSPLLMTIYYSPLLQLSSNPFYAPLSSFNLRYNIISGLSICRSLSLLSSSSGPLSRLILHDILICFLCGYYFYGGEYHYSCRHRFWSGRGSPTANFFNTTFHYDGYVSDCTYIIIKYFFFFTLQNNNFSYKIEGCSS